MRFIKSKGKYYGFFLFVCVAFNLYFVFLMRDRHVKYLIYLDILLLTLLLIFGAVDYSRDKSFEKKKTELLRRRAVIYEELYPFENSDLVRHNIQILNEELNEKFQENCELQDYVAKWCHEVKIPLSAGLLAGEKIKEADIRHLMREQLERIRQQVNSMLLGCRLQSALFDIQIRQTLLAECVRTSVRNNQFFLIQKKFSLDIRLGEETVYTDPSWLVYILDQLINNAIKYAGESPALRIWTEESKEILDLFVEDNGEGIRTEDIRRIFEKGYTGANYHNGKYKSTGMGLYMVSKIAARLEHEIGVESEWGEYTRFQIRFQENSYYRM